MLRDFALAAILIFRLAFSTLRRGRVRLLYACLSQKSIECRVGRCSPAKKRRTNEKHDNGKKPQRLSQMSHPENHDPGIMELPPMVQLNFL